MGDKNRFKKAIDDFTVAISLDPKNPVIYTNRGLVYRKLEEFGLAVEDYSQEIEHLDSSNVEDQIKAFNNRAYCNAKLYNYNLAIDDYSTVLGHSKFNIHALHNRGISYERSNRYREVSN